MKHILKKALESRAGKTNLSFLTDHVMELVIAAILIAIGLSLLSGVKTNEESGDNNTLVVSAINKSIVALATFPNWFKLLVLVIIFVVIVAYVWNMKSVSDAGSAR